jgi:hypothetical protein
VTISFITQIHDKECVRALLDLDKERAYAIPLVRPLITITPSRLEEDGRVF